MKVVFHAGNGDQGLTITVEYGIVTLEGYLVDDHDTRACIDEVMRYMASSGRIKWVIVAGDCSIAAHGDSLWIDKVPEYLMACELEYGDSQLSLIIQCDQGYNHPATTHQNPM